MKTLNDYKKEGFISKDYTMLTYSGKYIRKAPLVIFPDDFETKFIDKMGKKNAIEQAINLREENYMKKRYKNETQTKKK